MARPETSLRLEGVSFAYRKENVVSDVSLGVADGEMIGIVGPNGSGKSTLLKLLAGKDEPDAGTRMLKRGVRVGYLAQNDAFPPGWDLLMTPFDVRPLGWAL